MTKTLINITNHRLTPTQCEGYDRVVNMPPDIAACWSQVGVTEAEVFTAVNTVTDWLGDIFLNGAEAHVAVQGHYGATVAVVRWINYLLTDTHIAVYSSSVRESVEETQPDGSVVKRSVFRHVAWNAY